MAKEELPNDLNLNLIEMVQSARMLHDAEARPSDLAAVYWIEAKRKAGDFAAPSANAGEWRVPLMAETADAVWERVKAMTVAGKLGYKSKISTRPAAGQVDLNQRLLCVRTYDADDREDVKRVETALLAIGMTCLEYVADKTQFQAL